MKPWLRDIPARMLRTKHWSVVIGTAAMALLGACSSDDSSASTMSTGTGTSGGASGSGGTTTTTSTGGSAGAETTGEAGSQMQAPIEAGAADTGSLGAQDSAVAPIDAGTTGEASTRSKKDYLCNLIMGPSVTYDWFTNGFENGVDGSRWEAMASSMALVSFIQQWNDPNNALWSMAKLSPCTQNANTPDRVIFTPVNWDYTTSAEWVPQLDAIVKLLQMKFHGVKEIDLLTMLRAPNNMSCGSVETVVQPFLDEAIATVAAKYPGLVEVSPKFYAPSCNVFTGGGPHFTDAGKQVVAKVFSDYYGKEP
jgi:hypothetical protein